MLNKLKTTQYLVVAGGALMLVFGLLKWFSWKYFTDDVQVAKAQKSNAFDYLLTGVVPYFLIVGAALVTVLLATGALNPGKVPWPLAILGATVLGTLLLIIRLIMSHDAEALEGAKAEVSRGIGIWISAVGGVLATAGASLTYQGDSFDSNTSLSSGGRPQPDRELPPPAS